jgi:hypothetical protein
VKKVVVKLEINMVVEAQDEDTAEDVEFFLNESSHCIENELDALSNNFKKGFCVACANSKVTYLRDADEHDLENVPSAVL